MEIQRGNTASILSSLPKPKQVLEDSTYITASCMCCVLCFVMLFVYAYLFKFSFIITIFILVKFINVYICI